jgi:hypothetical protein
MMKKVTVLICFLVLLGYSAYGDQAAWQGKEESQIRQAQGGEIFPQGKPRFGPPEEAYKACEGKAAGSASQFTGSDGVTVTGTCGMDGERLVLRPDRPRGNSQDKRRSPPPEAYRACEGRSTGSEAQFVNPRGEIVKGTCQEQEGKLLLRPYSNKDGMQGQASDQSGKGSIER